VRLGDKLLSPNGINAILFDLDGTLRHNRPSYYQAFFDFSTKAGAQDSPENRVRATRWLHYYWAQSEEMLEDKEKFGLQEDLFWINHARRGLIAYGCPPHRADELAPEVHRQFNEKYDPEDWVPEEVLETLETLKKSGYYLAVLSNRTHPFQEYMHTWGLEPYFDLAIAAGEIDAYKPEPIVFARTLKKMDKSPAETLYVGDNYYADVIGAQRAGLPALLLDPDGIFPEADCPVIRRLKELTIYLEK
jgi:HAD superfamily hydrolase (TIGR01549 family)